MSEAAWTALAEADAVLGYKTYIEQVRHLLDGKKVLSSAMTKELDRAGEALDLARQGLRTALISGGDPGIYAMAGVVFELAQARELPLGTGPGQVDIQVIPGIPALAAAAALLGAPLTHDFAAISLSDRLTPWEVIEKRLNAAAGGDFVIVLYNPKSKGRTWQFEKACEIIRKHRPPETPVGLVTRAMREGQEVRLTTLGQAPQDPVDMQTVALIGNSQTFVYQNHLITPRGYLEKYPDKAE